MKNSKKTPKKSIQASIIGETEAMQMAAIRGLSLSDVGINESIKNQMEFFKIKREVNKIREEGKGVIISSS